MEARGVVRRFGSFTALDGVTFSVRPGEIHALLGENGAGKSTLMNVLSGLLRPSEGQLFLGGQPALLRSPADASQKGVGMVHQHFLLVPPLTVAENLLLSASKTSGGALSYPIQKVLDEARALAAKLGWEIPFDAPAGSLPVGTQQRVEILKALRGETRLLIFDEPTAVLTPTETPELFATLKRLASEGKGIVFISHKLDEVLALADRITVLRRGKVVAHFAAGEADQDVLAAAMVGEDSDAAKMLALTPPPPLPSAPRSSDGRGGVIDERLPSFALRHEGVSERGAGGERISVENLTVSGSGGKPLLDGVSFSVAPGEIFGIAGVDGNGQRELEECLMGLRRPSLGSITLDGEAISVSPAAFRRAGITAVPADRQRRGLALPLSITENVALGGYDDPRFSRGPLLDWKALRARTGELIQRFDIRASGPDSAAASLSGGNQQKVVIARALADSPKVVLAVNPTRGLDVGAIAFVHDALRKAREAGAAIVLISTELDEVRALSDRIGVLFDGRLVGVVGPDATRETLGRLMGGVTCPPAPSNGGDAGEISPVTGGQGA